MNRRPLRPEQGTQGYERPARGRRCRSVTSARRRQPRLSAPDGSWPLPFRSQNPNPIFGRHRMGGTAPNRGPTEIELTMPSMPTRRPWCCAAAATLQQPVPLAFRLPKHTNPAILALVPKFSAATGNVCPVSIEADAAAGRRRKCRSARGPGRLGAAAVCWPLSRVSRAGHDLVTFGSCERPARPETGSSGALAQSGLRADGGSPWLGCLW